MPDPRHRGQVAERNLQGRTPPCTSLAEASLNNARRLRCTHRSYAGTSGYSLRHFYTSEKARPVRAHPSSRDFLRNRLPDISPALDAVWSCLRFQRVCPLFSESPHASRDGNGCLVRWVLLATSSLDAEAGWDIDQGMEPEETGGSGLPPYRGRMDGTLAKDSQRVISA